MINKTTQGLGNKNLLSFSKHDSLKYWRLKSNVNSHMSIQYICESIRVTILIIFRFVVSKESTCADNMNLYAAENFTSR
jgi:hypothetical protein